MSSQEHKDQSKSVDIKNVTDSRRKFLRKGTAGIVLTSLPVHSVWGAIKIVKSRYYLVADRLAHGKISLMVMAMAIGSFQSFLLYPETVVEMPIQMHKTLQTVTCHMWKK